ncbi:DNA polymerase Y family protein [Tunturiibacter gelidiferens]|uniref:DNA polymerase Y family protein n=1 Tax=Tunturiibacter gelidiferens TaxID=3069689 RepID=UPI003D9B53A4
MKNSAELYACLYAKEFPAQAMLRLRPQLRERPFAVMKGEAPLQQVCSLNSKARTLGVAHGMTKVEIDTFPSVSVLPRSQAEEHAARTAMLECAGSFSPRLEDRSDDTSLLLVIDIAGTERLLGSPSKMGTTLLQQAKSLGITARLAIASNFHSSICLARGMSNQLAEIPSGQESQALAQLPLTVLDLPEKLAETFSLWGIHTLGMLASLPEKALIARMGQEGRRLRLLARGELKHLFVPLEAPFTLEEHMELDTPVELLDSLLFVVGVLLEQLILRATARVLALASVTTTLSLEGGTSHTRTVRPALPTNNRQLWIKLLHLDLEAHPPQAAILALTLAAEPGTTSKVQLGLFSPQLPEPMRLDVTLARIRAIVGEDCVGRAVLKDTQQPEGFTVEPFTVSSGSSTQVPPIRTRVAMRQLRPPENLTVTLSGRQPKAFFFRDRQYTVEQAYGPWLTGGDWWAPTLWGREQWDLIARSHDGTLLCCCLIRNLTQNCWQMAALYD